MVPPPTLKADKSAKFKEEAESSEPINDGALSVCSLCSEGVYPASQTHCILQCRGVLCDDTAYHTECIDRYVKRGVWRNRRSADTPGSRTGLYPCPRGDECKGLIISSHVRLPETDKKRKKKAAMEALMAQPAGPKPPPAPKPAAAPVPKPAPAARVPAASAPPPLASFQRAAEIITPEMTGQEKQRAWAAAARREIAGGTILGESEAGEASRAAAAVAAAAAPLPTAAPSSIPGAEWVGATVTAAGSSRRRRGAGGDKKEAATPLPPAAAGERPDAGQGAGSGSSSGHFVSSLDRYNNLVGITGGASAADHQAPAVPTWLDNQPSPEDAGGGSASQDAGGAAEAEQLYHTDDGQLLNLADYAAKYGMTTRALARMFNLPYDGPDDDDEEAEEAAAAAAEEEERRLASDTIAAELQGEVWEALPAEPAAPSWWSGAAAAPAAAPSTYGGADMGQVPAGAGWGTGLPQDMGRAQAWEAGKVAVVVEEEEEEDVDIDLLALCMS